jgi:hypothetical protein
MIWALLWALNYPDEWAIRIENGEIYLAPLSEVQT